MWSIIVKVLEWFLSLFKAKSDQRRDDIELGAATQRDEDRKADATIIRDAQNAVKKVDPNAPDPNDLDAPPSRGV